MTISFSHFLAAVGSAALVFTSAAAQVTNTSLPEEAILYVGQVDGPEENWAFTLTMQSRGEAVTARFDGARPEGEEWRLISPANGELTAVQRDIWAEMRQGADDRVEEDDKTQLFYSPERFGLMPAAATLTALTADESRYRYRPAEVPGDERSRFLAQAEGEIVVDHQSGQVRRVRLTNPESFKPNLVMRIDRLELDHHYRHMEHLPAPVLERSSIRIEGRAFMQEFSEHFEMQISDIEYRAD